MTQYNVQLQDGNGSLAGLRNELINGNFEIWQRGASFAINAIVSFTSDRWACNTQTGLTTTAEISVVAPVAAGLQYAIKNSGANFMALQQGVELARVASNMQFYVGSQWTLSFWSDEDQTSNPANVKWKNGLKDESGTALPVSSSFPNFQSTGETANGYTRYSATFTITADASTVANADCLAVILPVGPGQSATGVQLEPGPIATPFEQRAVGLEMNLCQRYYQKFTGNWLAYSYTSGTAIAVQQLFSVTMRTVPTTVLASPGGTVNWATITDATNQYGFSFAGTATAANNSAYIVDPAFDAEV